MEERTVRMVKISITAFLIVGTGCFWFLSGKTSPHIDKNGIKKYSYIPYASDLNYRQTPNNCGPYSTAAVIRVIKKIEINSQELSKNIQWRTPSGGTFPWGLEKQLKKHNLIIETPYVRGLSNEEKILFLQQQLSQNKPVIILGEKNNFQHYMTLLGFNDSKDEFYVYDSYHDKNINLPNLTLDDNGNLPGNRTLSSKALIDFWKKGGIFGTYQWYALIAG